MNDTLFYAGAGAILLLLLAWGALFWRGYAFTRSVLFRALPFVLVIGLFTLGFDAEHLR
jgi:hypothetical protein